MTDFMMSLSDDKQADLIDAFNTASRYLNDRIYTFVQLMPNKNDHFANRKYVRQMFDAFVRIDCLFVLLLYVPVNSYCHYGTVSSPNHTFSLAILK